MGRKGKVGKQRKDKYYQLAKESGYRSRASFKLIQLNRKFEFLQSSKVLIDLCAAPGGWLQVAQKFMPVSSVIVGVDLVPIKPIPNVITLQEDITTPKCRSQLKKNLKTWKADVVLHDGAPNVGKSWIHDAYEQNRLTLSALHLACDFLIKGGWFITKVFRSKDYNSLMWVLNKLFKKVFATKPQASRNESAEIFVVCQNFIAPDKIEAKFFDPSYVFADLEENEHKITANDLLKSAVKIKKAKAEGYDDGATMFYSKLDASKFIEDPNYADLLSKTSEIVLDTEHIKNHPSTTAEILECIKDIKVLGRKELLLLINWRKELRSELKKAQKKEKIEADLEKPIEDQNGDNDDDDDENESDVEEIDSFESEEAIKLKRKKKKMAKEKRKLAERMNLKMIIENDQLVQEEQDLFSLSKVLKSATIDQLQDVEPDLLDDEEEDEEEGEEETVEDEEKENDADYQAKNKKTKKISYDKDYNAECLIDPDDSGLSDDDDDYSSEIELDEDDFDETSNHGNEDKNDPIEEEEFSDEEEAARFQELVETIAKNRDRANQPTQQVDAEELPSVPEEQNGENEDEQKSNSITDKKSKNKTEKRKTLLSAEELALATELIKSKKSRRVLMDDAWNRYTNDDGDGAPSWFRKEEQIYCRKPFPISSEALKRTKETNPRINKKEIEAKARKKKRVLRRLDRARVKAENLTEDPSMSNKEKADCIRRIYKKASIKKDKQPSLVIAKKQYGNRRPPGVKGRYKIVDSRMKKDKRNNKQQNDNKGKKPKKKNKFFNKNKKQKSR